MHPIIQIIDVLVDIYVGLLIASAVLSWLISFKIINVHNRLVYQVLRLIWRVTEPPLRPIRRVIPNLGGIDFSPLILILAITIVWSLIRLQFEQPTGFY
ncbi:MAG: hypothetical protein CMM30_02675 [Rhodospirillaceae bacterium]|nr:hypothetical protein [Alphaproteobacteria bacterium]MBR71831.1 hypothetical protein [Rhodospirillaceae bacterium]|tara:strand:- start:964 stop:1260 length:297 start_codon:yes stop_codon:yes gene_type:complete